MYSCTFFRPESYQKNEVIQRFSDLFGEQNVSEIALVIRKASRPSTCVTRPRLWTLTNTESFAAARVPSNSRNCWG